MKPRLGVAATLAFVAWLGHAQTVKESQLDFARYGLTKPRCVWDPESVNFLDDDHLVVSAPVAYSCDRGDRDKTTDTRITVTDLEGRQLAARRADLVGIVPGPVGYVTVCTGDRLELLSRDLQVARSIVLSVSGKSSGCYFGGRLSPSRTAMAVADPANSQLRLYQGSSSDPIVEIKMSRARGESVRAVADDGFLVCVKERKQCEVVGSQGRVRSFTMPQLGGASGYYIVGLVAPDKLLVASFDGKRLYAETPTGETVAMGDVAKIRPPFMDASHTEMSAAEPRRILYSVDGCLLGDFDDCYGVVFRRFAVFDSQTSRMLFRHSYAPDANLKISPNGHIVMEQEGTQVHLFRIP